MAIILSVQKICIPGTCLEKVYTCNELNINIYTILLNTYNYHITDRNQSIHTIITLKLK